MTVKNCTILTPAQMTEVKGGTSLNASLLSVKVDVTLTPSATSDDKRRERPGGGISTY